ncbi:MAG: hypothetical protein IKD22_02975 [Lentisphaeria bacterium]|nr:hypothetical protein [Lentisphaeria bacterium]
MKKYLLPAMLAASQLLLALEFPVFPEKFIRPMVGFEKWQCGKTAILTEQGRAYAYTSAITGNFAAEKFRFFNVKLEAAGDVKGKLTIYFSNKGKKFAAGDFCRKTFELAANTPAVVSIPMKGVNWQGNIAAFRFDLSAKTGTEWTIHKVWFSSEAPREKKSGDLMVFPGGKPVRGMLGFKHFAVKNGEIHAEQSRDYAYTAPVKVDMDAGNYRYLNLLVKTATASEGSFSIYFAAPGEKRFLSAKRLRTKYSLSGGREELISLRLNGSWRGKIDRFRMDFSAAAGQQWIIRKIWFSQQPPFIFRNPELNCGKSFSGICKLVENRYDLLEGREYAFAFDLAGKNCEKTVISAVYYNDIGTKLGENSTVSTINGRAELRFTPPESTSQVELTTEICGQNASGKIGNFSLSETGKRAGAVWQASWICHPRGRRTANPSTFLYIKEFELASLPLDARLQLTADDGYELRVNGKSIGKRPGGWQQTALYDVSDAVKPGRNRIEIVVNNDNGPTALIAELRCDMTDGKIITIKSDRTFQVKQLSGSSQLLPLVPAMELGIPPVPPWHSVAYNYMYRREKVAVKSNTLKYSNGRISGKITFDRCSQKHLALLVSFAGGIAGKYVVPVNSGTAAVDIDVKKSNLRPGDYVLNIDTANVKAVPELLRFTVPPRGKEKNIRMSMAQRNGNLQVLMDGKPLWFSGFRARRATQRERAYRDGDYRIMFFGASKGASDGSTAGRTWVGPDRYEFDTLIESLGQFCRKFPEARFIITCGIDGPVWWAKAHPEECVWFENSPKAEGLTSLASAKWRRESTAALRELIRNMEKSPYASRIIGYRIQAHCSGGEFQYLGTWQRKYADYSPAMQNYFREFLTRRYGSDAALQKAWNNPQVTLKTAAIPTGKERKAAELMVFRDLDKARNVADFIDCLSDAMVTGAMEHLKVVRAEAPGKLAGLYGGYVFYYSGFQLLNSAHANFGKLYRSRLADFISSPHDYIQRKVGWPGGHHGPSVGTALYDLAWWDENDTRTIMCAPGGHRHVNSMHETIGVLKRDLILQVTKGLGNVFYDLAGGWFDHPGIMEALRKTNLIGKFALTLPNFRRGQVAVLYCTDSIKRLAQSHSVITDPLRNDFRRNLGWSGVTADQYLLEDILQDNFPEYDCYILPNVYAPGDKVRQAIKTKLMKPGKLVIFGYAPGAFRENQGKIDEKAMKELTGMEFKHEMRKIPRAVKMDGTVFGSGVKFGPLFYISDKKAEKLGVFQNTALTAVARKKTAGGATVVATMLPVMTPQLLRKLFQQQGMHIFCESSDPIYFDGRFIAIHANSDGRKTLRLPEAAEWYDLFRYKKVSGKAKEYSLQMVRGQTEIFFIGTEADFRRYAAMDKRK